MPPQAWLKILQHFLDKGNLGIAVAGRVVLPLCHIHRLHDAVVDEHRNALAAVIAQNRHWPRMLEHEPKCPREITARVTEERDHGAVHILVLRPSLHDGTIIHAEDNHIRDALRLQIILLGQVARHLPCGSSGCESARKAKYHHFLALTELSQRYLLRRKALVQTYIWDLIAYLEAFSFLLLLLQFSLACTPPNTLQLLSSCTSHCNT